MSKPTPKVSEIAVVFTVRNWRLELLVIGVTLAAACGGNSPSPRISTPETWFAEMDADYGSQLAQFIDDDDDGYIVAHDIKDDGYTFGRRENAACHHWFHVDTQPYMGGRSYRAFCGGVDEGVRRRSEQMLVSEWIAGPDARRYLSLAFRLQAPDPPRNPKSYIAQLHHTPGFPPAFAAAWTFKDIDPNDRHPAQLYLELGLYFDYIKADGTLEFQYVDFARQGSRHEDNVALQEGVWHHLLFVIDPGPLCEGEPKVCDACPGNQGEIVAFLMQNSTGLWQEVGRYNRDVITVEEPLAQPHVGRIGYWYKGERHTTNFKPNFNDDDCEYQWKMGVYRNDVDTLVQDYDNIRYARRWYRITDNRLIGYHKSVVSYSFEEWMSTDVLDTSWQFNQGSQGDPYADRNHDGTLQGSVPRIPDGRVGRALHLSGNGHVFAPLTSDDFDFGNYLTVAIWFRTKAALPTEKGLFQVDGFPDPESWKLLMTIANDKLSFGVRHTNNSVTRADLPLTPAYFMGTWHHVVGTYNRFAPDGRRLKLYVDGRVRLEIEGAPLPLLRGELGMLVGQLFPAGRFVGSIDELRVLNYALTPEQVATMYEHELAGVRYHH